MKKIPVTKQLIDLFGQQPQSLILQGYCLYAPQVEVYTDGVSYALTTNIRGNNHCCICSSDIGFVSQVVASLHGIWEFSGVPTFVTHFVKQQYSLLWETSCYLYCWDGKPIDHPQGDIRAMDPALAQQISDGTHYHAEVEEIKQCLAMHPSSALYIDDKPVCWCILHWEQSLGMLYTLPEHRHKGYALKVMQSLCNKVIDRGATPYAYIVTSNVASISLAAKYNLVKVDCADYFQVDLP